MAESAKTGLLDLEKELSCSICTEVLYQPLTLLDCLHTFCGSCLKEWFSWQALQVTSSKSNPFTCPSCRASVRETRPNATVTTLLEMYLQANPSRARTEQEKADTRKNYTPGEVVMPKRRRKEEGSEEEEDRRLVEEVRELSLQEVGIRSAGSYARGTRHRPRESTTVAGIENVRQRRRRERHHSTGAEVAGPSASTDPAVQARQIGHQSSLRSLLSTSEVDSVEMEEEILRQIMDEGILDGIDLNSIDVAQEDELSEKIAEAYRRRHRQREIPPDDQPSRPRASNTHERRSDLQEQQQHRRQGRSPDLVPVDLNTHSSHPPVSRPQLLEAYPTGHGHRRRTASETRRQTSPNPASHNSRTSSETQRQAARSATDLTARPQSSSSQQPRPTDFSNQGRRTTDSNRLRPGEGSGDSTSRSTQSSRSPRMRPHDNPSSRENAAAVPAPQRSPNVALSPAAPVVPGSPHHNGSPRASPQALPQPSMPIVAQQLPSFPEPSISCNRCGKAGLEYNLHMNCSVCNEGKYNVCLQCYHLDRGCLYWFGFGRAALERYRRQEPANGYPAQHPLPHRLTGHRYLPPPPETRHVSVSGSSVSTSSDPSSRLQAGPFCSNCSSFTPDCYWKCDACNQAEWGFCNPCVNQGKCCTHALLPVRYPDSKMAPIAAPSTREQHSSMMPLFQSPKPAMEGFPSGQPTKEQHIPLTFSIKCDICTYPIPPSNTRFHCSQCNAGEYDICSPCYYKLLSTGKLSIEDGPRGWRRCLNGHRMITVGFENSNLGQRRIVVEDLVGGLALKDDASGHNSDEYTGPQNGQRQITTIADAVTNRANGVKDPSPADDAAAPPLLKPYPPNGGEGMHMQAMWSWWPTEGQDIQLAFPKGAVIRECKAINAAWSSGTYCGRKGVFPREYAWELE